MSTVSGTLEDVLKGMSRIWHERIPANLLREILRVIDAANFSSLPSYITDSSLPTGMVQPIITNIKRAIPSLEHTRLDGQIVMVPFNSFHHPFRSTHRTTLPLLYEIYGIDGAQRTYEGHKIILEDPSEVDGAVKALSFMGTYSFVVPRAVPIPVRYDVHLIV